ncbi:hypothetical protein CkaCkLH20_09602 [Colletotrichum karsti]|uniref:Nuclear GTPase SLIP-GC n=1 Tax=Colletotrichum karsti TaxID=1095194 RepID=A0A9P6LI03_9PEZI|nr:uncharacterized protein CkaCkLH20_09602 [Colletotrichum karsti]KAF9873092.1 hypothetical protein CkaCkLH20_09602 [Colletotrichum karsti]
MKTERSRSLGRQDTPSHSRHRQYLEQPAHIPKLNMVFSVLQNLKAEMNPKVWEAHVAKALPILDQLEPICKRIAFCSKLNPEIQAAASHWIKQIANARERATQTNNIIIGVFGNTGDGKSSTINALLGESDLLPTNCMRACTASITEISYNNDPDISFPYRAEIDFVSSDQWMRDIKNFLAEVQAQDGEFDWDENEPDSEAAKAVLLASSVFDLIRHPNVYPFLGTTQTLKAKTAEELRSLIEPYVDSSDKDDDEAVSYWPMVKGVRIFTKAEALSNGVRIVDLPGLQDSDAARTAIASDYMKACTGIWIVAPIHRAVDNKTAKDLMSDSFKRQLDLDQAFSSVTFICSKTDELTANDAIKNLKRKLAPKTHKAWAEARQYTQRIRTLENEVKKLRNNRMKTPQRRDDSNDSNDGRANKRMKTNDSDAKSKELEECKLRKDDLLHMVQADCIQLRNQISRETLKDYFSRVVLETRQQQLAARTNDNSKQPDVLDSEEISDHLPVFCISSHAFQAFEGLEGASDSTMGFTDVTDTEVPQLQQHAQKLTEELRIAKNKEVLTGICRLLNSVALWTQDTLDFAAALDIKTLSSILTTFEQDTVAMTGRCVQSLQGSMETLFNRMDTFATAANLKAAETAKKWCAAPKKGGIYHSTLKATFARNGTWRDLNFNEQLLEEFQSQIHDPWVETFQMDIPKHFDEFLFAVQPMLEQFHQSVLSQLGGGEDDEPQATTQLREQIILHQQSLRRLIVECKNDFNKAQKQANREPQRIVLTRMTPGYEECNSQSGKGAVSRMQMKITDHVDDCKDEMFTSAAEEPKDVLSNAERMVSEKLKTEVGKIIQTMRSDYTLALAKREESARREEAAFKESMVIVLELAQPLVN